MFGFVTAHKAPDSMAPVSRSISIPVCLDQPRQSGNNIALNSIVNYRFIVVVGEVPVSLCHLLNETTA